MTLAELRAACLANLDDTAQSFFASVDVNRWINRAMLHVANWADAQQQGLFHVTSSAAAVSANKNWTSLAWSAFSIASPTLMKRPVIVYRTDYNTDEFKPLEMVPSEDRTNKLLPGGHDLPPVVVQATGLTFISPASINAAVLYVHLLPDMTSDSDSPGQTGGAGQANALPIEYQPLVELLATTWAAASENSETAAFWLAQYEAGRDQLLATFTRRVGARAGGAAR